MDPATMMMLASGAMSGLGALGQYFGKKTAPSTIQMPRFTPQQQAWQSQAGQMGMQGLQDPLAGFEPIAQQARSQFQTQTVPSLAERFTSFGQGGQRGSDFMGAMAGAGSELEESLAGMASQYGLQNRGLLQQLLGMGMQPSFDSIYQPQQMGGMQRLGTSMFEQGIPMLSSAFQAQQTKDQMSAFEKLLKLMQSQGDR